MREGGSVCVRQGGGGDGCSRVAAQARLHGTG